VAFPIYGRVPPQQIVQTGAYADTIVVTVTF
jgi:spore coat protein U-like protein